ncbi:MAG: hypothetical protein IT228_10550 [Flavobacteriales bacterium]|nr:hypothetical protein [Flavobacteriales bacterium]MCC6577770.1 hypothetical protein [Flavobacteriales bacterium]
MRVLAGVVLAALAFDVQAQVAHGGAPFGWGGAERQADPPVVTLPTLDRAQLLAQDADSGTTAFRYGVQRAVAVDVAAQGRWSTTHDDRRVCRLLIESPGAVMLSVQFSLFDPAPEARVYLYDRHRQRYLGGFTELNERPDGTLATAVVPGDAVVIELVEPVPSPDTSRLEVGSITHGFRDVFGFGGQGLLRDYDPGYQSAPCNINVACPESAGWEQQIRSVAMFLRPDGNGCSGSLVNSTAQPGQPYFYFANHCLVPATIGQWVFYFNYQSPGCTGTVGNTSQTVTGGVLRAAYYYDDFALLELLDTPPLSYGVFYAGWDRSGAVPQASTLIHHPNYDVKKITFNDDPCTSYQDANGINLWRSEWDLGVSQAVSSGAPLFDQNKRVVGHMTEGTYSCSDPAQNWAGAAKFSASWDGASSTTRLRDWLDPANATVVLNGFDPQGTPPSTLPVRLKAFLQGPYNSVAMNMNGNLRASGMVPLTEPYTALGYAHVGGGGGETTTQAVLDVTGPASVVDWVVVELRDKNDPAQVLATRSGLLLRNGAVVDVDGSGDLGFAVAADDYHIAVRHRNHLGIMTQNPQPLGATAVLRDLTNGSVPLYGGSAATVNVNGVRVMPAGDATRNGQVKYAGGGNDRDPVLTRIGGTVPTATVAGYHPEDMNMDGTVKYSGGGNDRDVVLQAVGGSTPTGVRNAQLP